MMDLTDSYEVLELAYGSNLKAVKEAWKVLSQLYHPDRYKQGTKVYERALSKQKTLNIARDVILSWHKRNPGRVPPPPVSKPETQSRKSTSRKNSESRKTSSKAKNPRPADCQKCRETKARKPTQRSKKAEEKPIEPPARLKNLRDNIFEIIEKGDSGDDINLIKLAVLSVLGFTPIISLITVSGILLGPLLSGPIGLFVFMLGIAGAAFMIQWYRVERDVWKAETSTETKYFDEAPDDVFQKVSQELKKNIQPVQWKVQAKSVDNSNQKYRLHASLEPVAFERFDQRIDLYLEVRKCFESSVVCYDFRVNAPGHRFTARKIISDFERSLDSVVNS